ncbi:MAG: archaetidylserine decarboxylase [Halopseudomonas sp.]|uniref:archaetidylserine decarboxylase n=1 Tax=Halopseudomonas sp. TaxID=2901191 RepID=UPI00300214DC
MLERLFVVMQYLLPHQLLSSLAGSLADCTWPWVKNPFIKAFVAHFKVDMSEALEEDPTAYPSFNEFFTRAMKPDARPLDLTPGGVLSPADGTVNQLGKIEHGRIFQAKGHSFSVTELLGGNPEHAAAFQGGDFATVYLSPSNYHRVHMPFTGTLTDMTYVPGRLFSVNQTTTNHVPELFARNERVVCLFDTEVGPMAVVLVGAMIVASIETTWAGLVTPHRRRLGSIQYGKTAPTLIRGEEMGRFKLGSTVIVLFGPNVANWQAELKAGSGVCMGQLLGTTQA